MRSAPSLPRSSLGKAVRQWIKQPQGGITADQLAAAKKANIIDSSAELGKLTMDQIAAFYPWYLNNYLRNSGGIGVLDSFGDQKIAATLADSIVRYGGSGIQPIQAGINATLSQLTPAQRDANGLPSSVKVDGQVGPTTISILLKLSGINDSTDQSLRNNIANARINKATVGVGANQRVIYPGDVNRAKSYK